MSLHYSMLRCPEQTTIRYAARSVGATGHIERNGSDIHQEYCSTVAPNGETTNEGGSISVSRAISFESTTGTVVRRLQTRGERDGQSTDSGISDISDKEDENARKHLSPNVTNGYMAIALSTSRPPNVDVGIQCGHTDIQTNTSASEPPIKHVSDFEPVRNDSGNSHQDGAAGQTKKTILNPPTGMHGPGRFRDDPRIDSKYVGMNNAAALPLDLTAMCSSKTSSKTINSNPPTAHQHPSLVARLNQPPEKATRPLIDRFGAVSQESVSTRTHPEPSPTPPNRSNSIPSPITTQPPFYPIQQPPGEMYDRFKFDRGLTYRAPLLEPLSNNAPPPPVARSLPNKGVPIPPTNNGIPHLVYGPRFNTKVPHPVSRSLPNSSGITEPLAEHMNTSQLINSPVQPNQPNLIRNTVNFQSSGQYIQNVPVPQQNGQATFPNQQQPSTTNTFTENRPQMFPYYTQQFQQGPPFYHANIFQNQSVRTRGPACANFYPNQFPAPSQNLLHMYQMRPQMMPFVNQQHIVQGDSVPRLKSRKRKHSQRRNVDATSDNSKENTVNEIISNIMGECQSKVKPFQADIPASGSDRTGASREISTVVSNIPDQAMPTNSPSSFPSLRTGASAASRSCDNVQPRSEVNKSAIKNCFAPITPPDPILGLSSGPVIKPQTSDEPTQYPRHRSMVDGTVIATSSTRSSVRPPSVSHVTARTSKTDSDIVNNNKTAEECNMHYEELGNKIDFQRSLSVPNMTEQEDCCKTSASRNPHQAATLGRNIFEEMCAVPKESYLSLLEQVPVKHPGPSPESTLQNQLVSLDVDRKTTSPRDQSSSYHRNLPKKRHLFEKHLSDSSITPPTVLSVNIEQRETTAKQIEESDIATKLLKSTEEQCKNDVVSQSKVGFDASKSTRMGPKNSFISVQAPTQNLNSNQKEQSQPRQMPTINLSGPQLQDSSQNPRPPSAFPHLFNYRFCPPTDIAPPRSSPVIHSGQMHQMAPPWPQNMVPYPQCQRQIPQYEFPGTCPSSMPSTPTPNAPSNPPQKLDIKKELAAFMKERQKRKNNIQNNIQNSSQPVKEFTVPVDPRYVPLQMLQAPYQNCPLAFFDQNGMEWRPVDQNRIPVQSSNGIKAPVMKHAAHLEVGPNRFNLKRESLPRISISQNNQQQQDNDFVNAGNCEKLHFNVNQTDGNTVVMNTSRLTGVDGVIIKVDEHTLMEVRGRKKRGRKRKVPETALVPKNVFVRAEERRKRHKLLPTPEALALGETNTEDNNKPHSLRYLAASALDKLQSNKHVIKPVDALCQATTQDVPSEPIGILPRLKAKHYEVLAENMIASLVKGACFEREYRKTGLSGYRGIVNEQNMLPDLGHHANFPNRNMDQAVVELQQTQSNIPNRCITSTADKILTPSDQVIWMHDPPNKETEVRKASGLKKQKVNGIDTGLRDNKRNIDIKHYRPKGLKKPKTRLEDISETIMEVVRDSKSGQVSPDKNVTGVREVDVSSMGTIEVDTEPFEESSTEMEITSVVDYETQLREILSPKTPAVVNEILEDMQLELRGCLPELARADDSNSENSTDDSSEGSSEDSSDSDSDDEVHLGMVMLDGKEYRMRVVVEEDGSHGPKSESDSNDESSESRSSSRASADTSFEDSYVDEGVDTFQDVDMLDENDDVFSDTEDHIGRNPRRGTVSKSSEKTDSDNGERDISHKRTHSETSCSLNADETDEIVTEEPEFTCEKSYSEPQLTSKDVSKSMNDNGVAETDNDQFRNTTSDEVYVIEDFNYTDKNGDRHDNIDEDKITDAIDIDESVTHQVDIEFVKVGKQTSSLPETLFERFGMNGDQSNQNSSDEEEDCHMYVAESDVIIPVETAGQETEQSEVDCSAPSLSLREQVSSEQSPRSVREHSYPAPSPLPILDAPTETDGMPILFPCVERDPPMVSPCEEPPILQYLGKPKYSPRSDRHDTASTTRNLCVKNIHFLGRSRKHLKKRKKPKMISVLHENVILRNENEKENNERDTRALITNKNVAKPAYRLAFQSGNGYSSDLDQEVSDYEKQFVGRNNCELRSLGPSPAIEAKSRPFSPVNYNPCGYPKDRTVSDYCCQCRKNGKLRSPNRLHSLDEICPYSRYTKIINDIHYKYSNSDELTDSGGRRRSGKNGFKTDISSDESKVQHTESEFVPNDNLKPRPVRTSPCDLDLDDTIFNRCSDLTVENTMEENYKTIPRLQEKAVEIDDQSQSAGSVVSRHTCDTDALLNLLELSNDGSDSSQYRDDNGCDDFLYSSYENFPALSDSMNSLKIQNEIDTDSDATQIQSASGHFESDSDVCIASVSELWNDLQKCWVDLCDIGDFLQGKSRVKICDFVLYNESLCKPPTGRLAEISRDPHTERLDHERRIHQLKNKLKEVQRQMNVLHMK